MAHMGEGYRDYLSESTSPPIFLLCVFLSGAGFSDKQKDAYKDHRDFLLNHDVQPQ